MSKGKAQRKSRKKDDRVYNITVHEIDPYAPGSFKLAEDALRLWDKFQKLSEVFRHMNAIYSALEVERVETRREKLTQELESLAAEGREIGFEILQESKQVLQKFVTIEDEGVTWDEVYESLSLEEVRQIIDAVTENPFAFLHLMTTSEENFEENVSQGN